MVQDGRIQKDLNAMRHDMSRLRSDIGELIGRMVEDGMGRGGAMKERMMAHGQRMRSATEGKIHERPFMAVLMVLLGGLLLGGLLGRGAGR